MANNRQPQIGFTCGCFDVLHYGYVLMLRECKRHCDHLVVGVAATQKQEKAPLVNGLRSRLETMRAVRYVDEVLVYDGPWELGALLREVKPDVRLIGDDHIGQSFDGAKLCAELGIRIIYTPRRHEHSLTNLRERMRRAG